MKFLFVLYSGRFPYHWNEVDVVLSARPGCDGQGRWSVRELTGLQKAGARHELFLIEKLEGMKLKAINGLMYWKKFYYRPLGEFEQVCWLCWCIFYLQEVLAAKIATQSGHSSCNAMKIGYSMKLLSSNCTGFGPWFPLHSSGIHLSVVFTGCCSVHWLPLGRLG